VLGRLLRHLRAIVPGRSSDAEEAADADQDGDSGFLRSRLDASVLAAHGDGNHDGERELADLREESRRLADERRER